jgi:hypothetical protein
VSLLNVYAVTSDPCPVEKKKLMWTCWADSDKIISLGILHRYARKNLPQFHADRVTVKVYRLYNLMRIPTIVRLFVP